MAFSIVSAVARYLTPEVVQKIASASNLDEPGAQRAVKAAVPAILSTLVSVVAKPGGARELANAVADQPKGLLTNIHRKLIRSSQIASGNNLLSSLLGDRAFSMLASTLCQFVGVGSGSMQTVMGMLTPVIMGVLGNQQRAGNLDADALARLLTAQKNPIAAAMPQGLSNALTKDDVYDSIGLTASLKRRTYDAFEVPSMRRMVDRSSGTNWVYRVLPLLALGGLLWFLLPSGRDDVVVVRSSQPVSKPGIGGKSIYLASVPDNWVSIGDAPNAYINHEIYNRRGEQLGTIKDILLDPEGKMAVAIVNVGHSLGIGDKDVAVPLTALQLEPQANGRRVVMDATTDALQTASSFERRPSLKR